MENQAAKISNTSQSEFEASEFDLSESESIRRKVYTNAHSHLLDELRWLNRLLAAQVLRLRQVNFYDALKNFKDFFIADEEIDALLAAGVFETNSNNVNQEPQELIAKLLSQAQEIRTETNRLVKISIEQNIFLPLVRLSRCFNLTEFEVQSLIICLAPQIDIRYEKLYAYLQNDITKKAPYVDLILNLICHSIQEKITVRDYFSTQAPLLKFKILEFIENGYAPLLSKCLKVNERIAGYLLGSQFIDSELEPVAQFHYSKQKFSELIIHKELKDYLLKFAEWYKKESSKNLIFSFYGPYGVGKKETAASLCRDLNLPLLVIDIDAILNLELPFRQIIELTCRESLILPAALYFKNTDSLVDRNDKVNYLKDQFLRTLNQYSWLSFIGSCQPLDIQDQLTQQRFVEIKFPVPDYQLRQQIWSFHLNGCQVISEETDIDILAGKFNFTNGQIRDAVASASNLAYWRSSGNGHITQQNLYEGCRARSNQKLRSLSQKINPQYTWKDIVLPNDQMDQLREITNYVKYKYVVYDDWGFDRKLSSGKGQNVLFSGPSGTGKTMAAEIIANELQMDLYKIDLSTVVSKYIGETEKNLSRIFAEAEISNAILFFDEADALFGKRSEVKDAHDRYANIEISYLLQRMDDFKGLVILATNLRHNMDEAFVRRMHFTVEFSFPEEDYRLRIWQNIIPKETPIETEIDFKFLSRNFKISGGNIKNIALAAAFYAADDGRVITMKHLILATRREFQKMGKLCVKTDFEKYYELI